MKLSEQDVNTKPNISIEGKMSSKDAGKVAIIMAWGKCISIIILSISSLITAIAFLIWRLTRWLS